MADPVTTFQQAQAAFNAALEARRADLIRVNKAIAAKEYEQSQLQTAKPHTDDIAASFLRGLNEAAKDYEAQFQQHVTEKYVTSDKAAASVKGNSREALSIGAPALADGRTHIRRDGRSADMPVGFSALAYFLRSIIAAEIPSLVDKYCPTARQGMKGADRALALRQVQLELDVLTTERTQLEADLNAARAAVIR